MFFPIYLANLDYRRYEKTITLNI